MAVRRLPTDHGHKTHDPSYRPPPASSPRSDFRRLPKAGSVRQLASSRPPSGGSPTGPALRANPSPEVTDLFCRLPLPTLFYRPEAVHLGDLLRISVRPGTRANERSLGFSRAVDGAPDATSSVALGRAVEPISGQPDSRLEARREEKTTLPGTAAGVSEFARVAAFGRSRLRAPVREC